MRILIDDGMQINVGTGIGKYSKYLFETLKKYYGNNDIIDLYQYDKQNSGKRIGRIKYLWSINSSSFKKKCENYDIVHFTNYAIPFNRSGKVKYVVTIHDLAAFLFPNSLPKIYKMYNKFIVSYAIKNADCILTVSKSTKQEICNQWPEYEEKVKVIYPGLYTESKNKNIDINQYDSKILNISHINKFFLFIGTLEKRKNIGMIIKAFLKLKEEGKGENYKLILAGRPGFGFDEYQSLINCSKYKEDIIITGYVTSDDCCRLYKNASAYIFPSEYEGFGSTQLECMANHLPIILSDIPTNREISNKYGLFFKLGDIDGLVDQMHRVIEKRLPDNLNQIADRLLEKYNWNTLIEKYYKTYQDILMRN